jgi:hypothetical protein
MLQEFQILIAASSCFELDPTAPHASHLTKKLAFLKLPLIVPNNDPFVDLQNGHGSIFVFIFFSVDANVKMLINVAGDPDESNDSECRVDCSKKRPSFMLDNPKPKPCENK